MNNRSTILIITSSINEIKQLSTVISSLLKGERYFVKRNSGCVDIFNDNCYIIVTYSGEPPYSHIRGLKYDYYLNLTNDREIEKVLVCGLRKNYTKEVDFDFTSDTTEPD